MKVLITLGATREPIDAVRFIGNRSSGKMGAAIAEAAMERGHAITAIVAAVSTPLPALPPPNRRVEVETARQMHDAVMREFTSHDLLIMAAAVADYRPVRVDSGKLPRTAALTIVCEPTEDIVSKAAIERRADQRIVAFSLEQVGEVERARRKMLEKRVDLMVFNPLPTMGSSEIQAIFLWPDGTSESLGRLAKAEMAARLLERAAALFRDRSFG